MFIQRKPNLVLVALLPLMLLFGALLARKLPVQASTDLVAHWKFDEIDAGTSAEDYIGSNDGIPGPGDGNFPIPSEEVAPVTFENLRSASFNGSNYFTINNPVSTDFSICAWVKTSSTGGGVDHWTSAPIMDAEWGGVALDFGFGVGNGGRLMFGNGGTPVGGGGLFDAQVNGTTQINDNEWHNVCVTRNNTNGEVKLYVDAQIDGSGTTGVGALTVRPEARIGWGYDGAALFNGLIDDVRVYDFVLNEDQLQNLTAGSDDPDSPPGPSGEIIVTTGIAPSELITKNQATLQGTASITGATWEDIEEQNMLAQFAFIAGTSSYAQDYETGPVLMMEEEEMFAFIQGLINDYPLTTPPGDFELDEITQDIHFSSQIGELLCNTTYYYRGIMVIAIQDFFIGALIMGEEESFTTLPCQDLNGDDIDDSEQSNVSAIVSPVTEKTVVLEVDDTCEVREMLIKGEDTHSVQDPGFDYPQGLLNFTLDCVTEGSTVTIKQYYYDVSVDELVARKYNPVTKTYFSISDATITSETINGESVAVLSYEVTDGGDLDVDGEVNGVIVDPAGLGVLAAISAPNTGLPPVQNLLPSIVAVVVGSVLLLTLGSPSLRRRVYGLLNS